jgi:hypothetical protein
VIREIFIDVLLRPISQRIEFEYIPFDINFEDFNVVSQRTLKPFLARNPALKSL